MRPYFLVHLLIPTLLGVPAVTAAAPELHSHDAIKKTVHQFLVQQTDGGSAAPEIQVDRIDTRLRLQRCDRPLETFLPPAGKTTGRVTVGVRCGGSKPWSLYVPARVRLFEEVVVARRDLRRGSLIRATDLQLERKDLTRLHRGYLLQPQQAIGQALERSIQRGRVLSPALLQTPDAVRRGSQVSIVADSGGISVRMKGQALGHGALGERIRVRNLSSGRELEARVVSAATVRVDI